MSSLSPDGEETKDGFRKRRKRPANWLKQAIKRGEVRDPTAPDPDEGKDYSGATVIQPPIATAEGTGTNGR
jgi:hypothetical protein